VSEPEPDGVAVYFADWCPHCTRFLRQLRERGLAGRVKLVDISDDDADPRWDELSIAVVPTALRWREGRVVERLDGALGRGLEADALERFLAS
jgi:thioredoxin-like negative regulator of GroEL